MRTQPNPEMVAFSMGAVLPHIPFKRDLRWQMAGLDPVEGISDGADSLNAGLKDLARFYTIQSLYNLKSDFINMHQGRSLQLVSAKTLSCWPC